MSLAYVSTCPVTADTYVNSDTYVPIPGLGTLDLSSPLLGGGGVALIGLYLGWGFSNDVTGFDFYVSIADTAAGHTALEFSLGGPVGINGIISLSAVYNIPAGAEPVLQANWKILGPRSLAIFPPTIFSFTAQVYPAVEVVQG